MIRYGGEGPVHGGRRPQVPLALGVVGVGAYRCVAGLVAAALWAKHFGLSVKVERKA
jgi:hypothetical protein